MAPVKEDKAPAAKKKPTVKKSEDKVKRPARGFHRFRNGVLNVSPKGSEKELVKNNQGSPLLRLPAELRVRIWELVLCGYSLYGVHVWHKRHYRMVPPASNPMLGLDLLRTCRQIYSETALLPYSGNVFSFWGVSLIKYDIQYLQPFQRAQIGSIVIRSAFENGLGGTGRGRLLNSPKAAFKFLPGLKRIHFVVVSRRVGAGLGVTAEERIKKIREHLEDLLSGREVSVTFEVEEYANLDYYKPWVSTLSTVRRTS